MKIIVSLETKTFEKLILGTFSDPYYASLLAESVLRAKNEEKVYTKVIIELAEDDDGQR